jgi:glycosyltransferase involved in cell wall biosynthesis
MKFCEDQASKGDSVPPPIKVILVTGSYPPDVCGTADYSARLEQSLANIGVEVEIFSGKQWTMRNAQKLVREIRQRNPDIVHVQYPTTGYGWKLGPQTMALLQPNVVTLHEASQGHFLRKLSLYPFTLRAKKIIFTNEYELRFVQRMAPWIVNQSTVIPIGSNIVPTSLSAARNPKTVTYFGLIRPKKGLEEAIELGRQLRQRSRLWKIRIVGIVMPGYEAYSQNLRERSVDLGVQWELGLSGQALSRALSSTDIAYVPFPDGASERRSSLIALLSFGAAVITTKGSHTPTAMRDAVWFATSPGEAASRVEALDSNANQKELLRQQAQAYAKKFDWQHIATAHRAIYQSVLRSSRHP